jgi:hypothetical protein
VPNDRVASRKACQKLIAVLVRLLFDEATNFALERSSVA